MQILIADDHAIVRIGLSIIIKEEFPYASITEATNAHEVNRAVLKTKFDMLLLDIQMPDTDGLSLLQQVLAISPDLRVLIVSLNPESVFALRYIQGGAYGYVQKSEDASKLRMALTRVAAGKKYMSDTTLDLVSSYIRNGNTGGSRFQQLSAREFEIALLLCKGQSTSEICRAMSLQAPTVSTHKRNIFQKLSVNNVFELLEVARQYNIV